ncbi:MAG: hypothetical protein ACPGU7_01485 [Gammaproteobacteria bacterium]
MTPKQTDTGTFTVLLEDFEVHTLPRIQSLLERLRKGDRLGTLDISFLTECCQNAQQLGALLDRHPEFHALASRILHLYHEIVDLARRNEGITFDLPPPWSADDLRA